MILTVCSEGGNQGASILALELATQISLKKKTLLIDLETLHPDLTTYIDKFQNPDFGIDAIFRRHKDITPKAIEQRSFVPQKHSFSFLPGVRKPFRSPVNHRQIRDLLIAADKFVDVVIVDCPGRLDVATGLHAIAQADHILRINSEHQAWKIKQRVDTMQEKVLFEKFNIQEKIHCVWIGKKDEDIPVDWVLPNIPSIQLDKVPKEYSAAVQKISTHIIGGNFVAEKKGVKQWISSLKMKFHS